MFGKKDKDKEYYDKKDTFNKIRSRSVEDFLENKLSTVWLKKGYSKSSVKEYVNHLLREIDYQKENFKVRVKEVLDEKERLLNEKNLLSKQLSEAVESLDKFEKSDDKTAELNQLIEELNIKLEKVTTERNLLESDNEKLNYKLSSVENKSSDDNTIQEKDELLNLIDSLTEELEKINKEKEDLINEKELLSEKLLNTNKELTSITNEEEKTKELESIISTLEAELDSFRNNSSTTELSTLQQKLEEANNKIEKLTNELIEEKVKSVEAKNSVSSEVLEKLSFFERENERLNEELNSTNVKLNSLQESNIFDNDLVVKNVQLQKNIDTLKSQLIEYDEIKNHNQMLAAEVLSLSRMTKELSNSERESKLKIINLENHLNEEKAKYYDDLKEMSNEFETEREYYNKLIKSSKFELEEEIKQKNSLIKERRDLQNRLSTCLEYLTELYDKVDYFKSSNKILTNQLREQRDKNRKISGLDIPELSAEVINDMKKTILELDSHSETEVDAKEVKEEDSNIENFGYIEKNNKVISIK